MSPSLTCAHCGSSLADGARFCASCGTQVAGGVTASSQREQRKTVTVLFADIAGSTQLGERLDPEAVRSLLARHFAEARTILERHGGTVEKFIGDAVMVVFGVPTAHEDDALRAVRAAAELLAAVERANSGTGTQARLSIRIGINTGEVVTGAGSAETLVTGDAVNTAARLEQAAGVGEIVIGMPTLELVHDAVEAERLEPIAAKGKADAVEAARVLRVIGEVGRQRREAAPMVGREAELAVLTDAFGRAVSSGAMGLMTVVAPAGLGKSRLLRELTVALADRATVAKGRCLPYGDGITYWPIREILHQLAGIDEGHAASEMRAMLHTLQAPDESVEPIAALVGLDAPTQRQDQLFWTARRVLEHAAGREPLVLLVEDLHWADDTLLDLLEYVAAAAAGPILVVATARPELFDRRPSWKGTGIHLDLTALDAAAADAVLSNQLGGDALPSELRERIVAAADGNPLFLEEMVAMLREGGALRERDGTWHLDEAPASLDIPPSIQALLAARLDQLEGSERSVLQHGSVIGRTFEAAAVAEIRPGDGTDRLAQVLMSLVRRELLRPERADVTDGDAYRFRHILIRDAAYRALAKADRAGLHERFATWLEEAAGDRIGEYEEIVAHHLERALRYREELGDADLDGLRRSAAEWALRAGMRAQARDDASAAIALLSNAEELGRGFYDIEIAALRALAGELGPTSDFEERRRVINRSLEIAREAGDDREEAWALVHGIILHRSTAPATWVAEAQRHLPEAIRVLEAAGDSGGLAGAWHTLALAAWPDNDAATVASEQAVRYGRLTNDPQTLGWALIGRVTPLLNDDTPVAKAIPIVEGIADETRQLGRLFHADVSADLAVLHAMAGRHGDALALIEAARATLREFNYGLDLGETTTRLMIVHELAGHLERAEAPLRESIDLLQSAGEQDLWPYQTAMLARCLARHGRHDEAAALITKARVDDADPIREVLCLVASSHILASKGEMTVAVEEAKRAVDGIPSIWATRRGLLLIDLASVLQMAGRSDEARAALGEAREVGERKGNVALVALVDGELERLKEPIRRDV